MLAGGQNDRSFDGVDKLSDVAGSVVVDQHAHGQGDKVFDGFAVFGGEFLQEMLRQKGNVVPSDNDRDPDEMMRFNMISNRNAKFHPPLMESDMAAENDAIDQQIDAKSQG
jgi:hypothetical protein